MSSNTTQSKTVEQLYQEMIEQSNRPKKNEYSSDHKFSDGNLGTAFLHLGNEYDKVLSRNSDKLLKEFLVSSLAITNPESFPDVSNPYSYRTVFIPGLGGLVARSIPNAMAPIHPMLGLTTYTAQMAWQNYDRLKDLYEGSTYVRPSTDFPFIRTIKGKYDSSTAPYSDNTILPIAIPDYHEKDTVNMYGPNKTMVQYKYTTTNHKDGFVEYDKLFKDDKGKNLKIFRKCYDFLSEYCHPNMPGLLVGSHVTDNFELVIYEKSMFQDADFVILINYMIISCTYFFDIYDRSFTLLKENEQIPDLIKPNN